MRFIGACLKVRVDIISCSAISRCTRPPDGLPVYECNHGLIAEANYSVLEDRATWHERAQQCMDAGLGLAVWDTMDAWLDLLDVAAHAGSTMTTAIYTALYNPTATSCSASACNTAYVRTRGNSYILRTGVEGNGFLYVHDGDGNRGLRLSMCMGSTI